MKCVGEFSDAITEDDDDDDELSSEMSMSL